MKILCVADHIDPLVYSPNVKQRFSDVELVISAGDLPMRYLGFLSSSFNKPVVFVFGNHNLDNFHRFKKRPAIASSNPAGEPVETNYFGSTSAEDRMVKVKDLLILGLGGSRRYNKGEHQYTEFQMFTRMLRKVPRLLWNKLVHGRYLDILLTHASPYGIHDKADACHMGFKSFLWFMDKFKPEYLLHGHIHLYDLNAQRETRYNGTTVINVYDHYILDTEERQAHG
jgi:Icc-related predicted phosphoesterase